MRRYNFGCLYGVALLTAEFVLQTRFIVYGRFLMKRIKLSIFIFCFFLTLMPLFSFDKGFTLGLRANFSGSLTDPHIDQKDKTYLGAAFMKGMLGFIMSGEAELTYIFDAKHYFNYQSNDGFGGLGWCFNLGVGNGFSGQISGQKNETLGDIHVYCKVYMSPVLSFGTGIKTYLLGNRLVFGFTLGGKMPLDPHPTYELYTNLTEEQLKTFKNDTTIDFYPETGSLIITDELMKKINPLGVLLKASVEYCQPVIRSMELVLGGYLQYYVYRPGYVTMPKKVEHAAKVNGEKEGRNINFQRDKINSFYMNSFDFGISIGLLFKV